MAIFIPEQIVFDWVKKISAIGVQVISLADTVGIATPEQVFNVTDYLIKKMPQREIGVHLHSTPDNWKEKLDAAVKAGCNST